MNLSRTCLKLTSLLVFMVNAACADAAFAVVGGFAVTTSSHVVFLDGDGDTVLNSVTDALTDSVGLANGNMVGRIGADQWRLFDASGAIVATRQLDNLGTFVDSVPVGNGGYAAVTDSNIIFVAADGDTINGVVNDAVTFGTSLTNGNMVALKGADLWRLYDANGNVVTRALDNSGLFTGVAALGGGGYAAVSDSRVIFMGADGLTVNNVVTDVVSSPTSLSNGNMVGRIGTDVWRLYDPSGNTLFTRALDSLGNFLGAAAVGGGGYVAYTDANAIFVAADGNTVASVVPNALEFVTSLNNGNVVGKIVGTDLWRLFDPAGNILATRQLDNLGTFTGAAPTGLAMQSLLPGDFDDDGIVGGLDLTIWKNNFGTPAGASASTGDADSDGDVDGLDFLIWQRNFTSSPSAFSVPEPAFGLTASFVAAIGAAVRRLRCRRETHAARWV